MAQGRVSLCAFSWLVLGFGPAARWLVSARHVPVVMKQNVSAAQCIARVSRPRQNQQRLTYVYDRQLNEAISGKRQQGG